MSKKPFGFDKPQDSPGFLLWQTTMLWQRHIKNALEPYNIAHSQFVIMATLLWFEMHEQDITQAFIVNWTKLDKMTVSKGIRDLVVRGLINRVEHETDLRAKNVSLTDDGKKMIQALVPIVEAIDEKFFGTVQNIEKERLIDILGKLITG